MNILADKLSLNVRQYIHSSIPYTHNQTFSVLSDLNLIEFYLDIGNAHTARQLLGQINSSKIPLELRQEILSRIEQLEIDRLFEYEIDHYTNDMREAIEDKNLSLNPRLRQGLKNMPVEWINAACEIYNLKPARLRPDREKQLIEHLQQSEVLQKIIAELEEDEISLLRYLLQQEGWSRIGPVTRKFGSMDGDGFFWNEDGPCSTLGYLWNLGLVFVGRTTLNNRSTKIVTIPVELRPLLIGILQ